MAVRYLTLVNFTDEGIRHAANSSKRASDFEATVAEAGGKVLSTYWAVGRYDGAVTFEAPDEGTAAKLLLKLAQQGFVRTESLKVYNASEFGALVD